MSGMFSSASAPDILRPTHVDAGRHDAAAPNLRAPDQETA